MTFIHFSKAERIAKSVSLITVIVQVSKVLSPAIFRILPLKLISIGVILEAGSAAALTKNLDLSFTSLSIDIESGKASSTSNRFGLAPPPVNLLLKSVIFLNGGLLNCVAIAFYTLCV